MLPTVESKGKSCEGIFIKVVALHKNKKNAIGILDNIPFTTQPSQKAHDIYSWDECDVLI